MKQNPWILHVQAYRSSHSCSYKHALVAARSTFRSSSSAALGKRKRPYDGEEVKNNGSNSDLWECVKPPVKGLSGKAKRDAVKNACVRSKRGEHKSKQLCIESRECQPSNIVIQIAGLNPMQIRDDVYLYEQNKPFNIQVNSENGTVLNGILYVMHINDQGDIKVVAPSALPQSKNIKRLPVQFGGYQMSFTSKDKREEYEKFTAAFLPGNPKPFTGVLPEMLQNVPPASAATFRDYLEKSGAEFASLMVCSTPQGLTSGTFVPNVPTGITRSLF